MSNDQSYRPRSPDLPGITTSQSPVQSRRQQPPPPRLTRLPSYQIQEPSLPQGYSFSPRGSYDASPFFSQPLSQQTPDSQVTTEPGHSFSGQSPPRFTPASLPDQPQVYSPISYGEPPHSHQVTNSFPKQHTGFLPLQQQQQHNHPYQPQIDDMARLRSRKPVNYNEDHNSAQYEEPMPTYQQPPQMPPIPQQPQQLQQVQQVQQHPAAHSFMQPLPFGNPMQVNMQQQFQQHMPQQIPQHMPQQTPQHMPQQIPQPPPQPTGPPLPQVDVRTKFPVARIKRIMQADEDVGKVAQATPTAVSKALELFMIALVTKGATEAKNNNSKRVTATHLKQALLTDPQFDFLNEICESVPDEGGKGSKGRAKSEAKSEESDEDMGGMPKKKGKGGRKKKGGEGEASD